MSLYLKHYSMIEVLKALFKTAVLNERCQKRRADNSIKLPALRPCISFTDTYGLTTRLYIEQANRWGCTTILLEVAHANKKGLIFFSKHGFQNVTDLPEYYGRDIDGVLMERGI